MRVTGVEPAQPCGYKNLNLTRLPIPPYPHYYTNIPIYFAFVKFFMPQNAVKLLFIDFTPQQKNDDRFGDIPYNPTYSDGVIRLFPTAKSDVFRQRKPAFPACKKSHNPTALFVFSRQSKNKRRYVSASPHNSEIFRKTPIKPDRLSLRELRSLSCFLQAVLLSFFHSRISRKESRRFKRAAKFRLSLD